MDFQTRKIKKIKHDNFKVETKKEQTPRYSSRGLTISISLLISLAIIIFLSIGIVKAFKSIDFSVFLSIAGTELKTDANGHTNFLIFGIGGLQHSGGELTDSILVASLDPKTKTLTMLSVPRDLYVKDSLIGNSRINQVYTNADAHFKSSTKALEYAKTKVEEIIGVPIQYWVKIDFQGFKDLIDALGGIDVVVDKNLNDPFYPKGETDGYEPFVLSAGPHHMDGELALKYARSRETTSDFDRAARQQKIIYAVKQKALETSVVLSKEKIEKILGVLKANVETNITVKEILTLGSYAKDLSEGKILQRLIHDDPGRCGGFLYTPDRAQYGGMFLLLPAGGNSSIQKYVDLNFNYPEIAKENATIHLLNGTPGIGIAGETKQVLRRYCFDIARFGNGRNKTTTQTTYYYRQKTDKDGNVIDSRPKALDFLEKLIPGKESTTIPLEYTEYTEDILLEMGSDYVSSPNYMEDPFYSLPPSIISAPAATTTTTGSTPGTGTTPPATTPASPTTGQKPLMPAPSTKP